MNYRTFSTWRLIAALVIAFYHFAHFAPSGATALIDRVELMRPMVDMFFIISGFLIFSAYRERISGLRAYRDYLARRFARIYPMHVFTMAFFVAVGLAGALGRIKTGQAALYDLNMILPNLLLVQAWGVTRELSLNYVSWCVSAEWFCYLALPLIVLFFRRGGLFGLLLLFALVVAVLETMTAYGVTQNIWLREDLWGAGRAFADFIAGAFVAALVEKTRPGLRSHWPAWLVMLAALISMQLGAPPYLSYGLVVGSIYLAAACERNAPEGSLWQERIAPVAAVSFGIYMWHPVVELFVLRFAWPRFIEPLGVNFYLFTIVPLVLTVAVARLSDRTVERWAGRWLKDLLSTRPAPGTAKIRPAAAAAE